MLEKVVNVGEMQVCGPAGDGNISAAYMSKLGAIGLENLKPGRQCHRMTSKVRSRYDCWSCSHTHALPMTMQNWTIIWELRSGTLSELITVVIILSYISLLLSW